MGLINVLFQASAVHSSKQQRRCLTLATLTISCEKLSRKKIRERQESNPGRLGVKRER